MSRDYISYEESSTWPAWVIGLILAGFAGAAVAIGVQGAETGRFPSLLVVALLGIGPLLFWLLLGRLQVRVTRTSVLVSFGFLPLIQKLLPFSDIMEIEAVRYSPLREFGGWGIKFGMGGKRAWTIRGNRAVRLEMRDGKQFYVGSQDPERLAERIRMAGGGRWAEDGSRM